jgi:hypothetical protein
MYLHKTRPLFLVLYTEMAEDIIRVVPKNRTGFTAIVMALGLLATAGQPAAVRAGAHG